MAMDFQKLRTDAKKEQQGAWVPMGDGSRIRVARINNKRFKEAMQLSLKPLSYLLQNNAADPEEIEKITIRNMAKHVLLEWDGFKDQGEDVPYSVEAAEKYLTEIPEFLERVSKLAGSFELFREQEVEITAKNSEPASVGN